MPLPPWFWEEYEDVPPVVVKVVEDEPVLDPSDKQAIIAAMLASPGGRQKLAASMAAPLRARRDYTAVGRKLFPVESIPDGALPIYDKDPGCDRRVRPSEEGGRTHPASE